MIKLSWIAEVILNIYYAGHAKATRKLEYEDFEQIVKMANASIMRKLYFDLKNSGEQFDYFGYQLELKEFDLPAKDARGRRVVVLDEDSTIIRLPKGMAIFCILPVSDDLTDEITPVTPGTNSLWSGPDFDDLMKYELRGRKIAFYNVPDCVEKVEVDGIFNDVDMDVPLDVAVDIMNIVLVETLKTLNVPIDKTDDGDQNLLTLKSKIAEKEGI